MKLLIIEDEQDLSNSIMTYLSSENYLCEQAFTYADAKMKVGLYDYDCIVLDLCCPVETDSISSRIFVPEDPWGHYRLC